MHHHHLGLDVGYSTVAMASVRHLRKAPITEAIVDFRIMPSADFQPDSLHRAPSLVGPDYPKALRPQATEARVDFKGPTAAASIRDLGFMGLWLKTQDEKTIAQFRPDGFTLNRLKPYTSWKQIRGEAFRLWELYRTTVEPALISRIALRYINRIEIPLPLVDLRDYLAAPPSTPPNLSGNLSSFLTRVVVREPSARIEAIITQTGDVPGKPEQTALLLDIDVISQAVYDKDGKSAWETMERLREMKNRIFFESITLKALELFK